MTKESDRSPGSDMKESLRDTAQEAKREGQRLATEVAKHAEGVVEERKNRAADYMHSMSAAIESGGRTLGDKGLETSAGFAEQVAGQISGFANDISGREPRQILQEVERFARERPTVFLGAAMLAGLGVSRFLKSSASSNQAGGAGEHQGIDPDMHRESSGEAVT